MPCIERRYADSGCQIVELDGHSLSKSGENMAKKILKPTGYVLSYR